MKPRSAIQSHRAGARTGILAAILFAALSQLATAQFTVVLGHFGSGGTSSGTTYTTSLIAVPSATTGAAGGGKVSLPGFFAVLNPISVDGTPELSAQRLPSGGLMISAAPAIPGWHFETSGTLAGWVASVGTSNPAIFTPTAGRWFVRMIGPNP